MNRKGRKKKSPLKVRKVSEEEMKEIAMEEAFLESLEPMRRETEENSPKE